MEIPTDIRPACVPCLEVLAEMAEKDQAKLVLFDTIVFPEEFAAEREQWRQPLNATVNFGRANFAAAVQLAVKCAGPLDGKCRRRL